MADMFIRSETVSGMADSIRKITNTEGKVNLGRFAKGEYEETFYKGVHTVSGNPIAIQYYDGGYTFGDPEAPPSTSEGEN